MNLEGLEDVGENTLTPIIREGRYLVELESAQAGKSKKTRKDYIRTEVKILEAKGENASKVGTNAAFFINEDSMYQKHLKQIAEYVRALVNDPSATITQQMVANLVDPVKQSDYKGTKFELEAKPVLDKDTGKVKTFNTGDVILNFIFTPHNPTTTPTTTTTGSTANVKARK